MTNFNLGGIGYDPRRPLPYDPCLSCYRGDSSRIIVIEGGRDWIAGCLIAMAGFTREESVAWVEAHWDTLMARKPNAPDRRAASLLLCRACAQRAHEHTGVPVHRRAEVKTATSLAALAEPQDGWEPPHAV